VAITAETPDMQEEINLVWRYLLPAFKEKKLPSDPVAVSSLQKKINSLALSLPVKSPGSLATQISGKTFIASPNDMHLQNISFNFINDRCEIKIQTDTAAHVFSFGAGKWEAGETTMPGPSLTGTRMENTGMIYPAKVMGAYTWKDANTLELVLRYIESPHTETFTCHFKDNKLTIEAARSLDFGKAKTVIEAVMK
jgi:hypothetical protein